MPLFPTPLRCALRERGFTLIELMITVVIVSVLAAMAVPNLRNMIARYQTSTVSDEMAILIATARMEAIRRGGNVVLQKKPAGANTCATNQEWSCGVTLWADDDRDGTQDANETVIRDLSVPAGVNLRNMSGTSPDRLTFNRWGLANGIGALNFRVTRTGISTADRTVCVTTGGRVRIIEGLTCP